MAEKKNNLGHFLHPKKAAKGTKPYAADQSSNVGVAKKPHVNAASKVQDTRLTAPVQTFVASKGTMKKKGKGF
jgi:hypothetical protein